MAAAKTIDIIGRSTSSSDDAVRQAVDEARRTVRNITGVDVVSKGLRGEGLNEWRALVRVAFLVERDERPASRARRSAAAPSNASPSRAASSGVMPVAAARWSAQRDWARRPSRISGSSSWHSAW